MQLLLRVCFNLCTKSKKVATDKWLLMDVVNAMLNVIAFQIVVAFPIPWFMDLNIKYNLDYLMIAVLVVSWLRFFIYFLLVREISQMLLTLYEMLADTLSFMFIVLCYMLIVGSVVTTLYQDVNPTKLGGMALTLKVLYDGGMAVFDYKGMGSDEFQFSIIQIAHVYFANILLFNFLIAILSFTYDTMQQISVFKYKVNVYRYAERYLIGFEEEKYSELVIHAPPVTILITAVLPFYMIRPLAGSLNKFVSYCIYWLENLVLALVFLFYELLLVPIVFGKTFVALLTSNQGLFTTMFYGIAWLVSGLVMNVALALRDIYFLLKILSMHQGCRAETGLADELKEVKIDPLVKLRVYNEVRETVIELYIELRR